MGARKRRRDLVENVKRRNLVSDAHDVALRWPIRVRAILAVTKRAAVAGLPAAAARISLASHPRHHFWLQPSVARNINFPKAASSAERYESPAVTQIHGSSKAHKPRLATFAK